MLKSKELGYKDLKKYNLESDKPLYTPPLARGVRDPKIEPSPWNQGGNGILVKRRFRKGPLPKTTKSKIKIKVHKRTQKCNKG